MFVFLSVSVFVSPQDLEARSRATTCYLPHRRLDMLPALLASDVASLHGGRERYAMTLFFSVRLSQKSTGLPVGAATAGTAAATGARLRDSLLALDEQEDLVVSVPPLPCWAGRTALRSCAAMTYSQAHRLMHGLAPEDRDSAPVPPGVAGGALSPGLWDPVTGNVSLRSGEGMTSLSVQCSPAQGPCTYIFEQNSMFLMKICYLAQREGTPSCFYK